MITCATRGKVYYSISISEGQNSAHFFQSVFGYLRGDFGVPSGCLRGAFGVRGCRVAAGTCIRHRSMTWTHDLGLITLDSCPWNHDLGLMPLVSCPWSHALGLMPLDSFLLDHLDAVWNLRGDWGGGGHSTSQYTNK